MKPRKKSAFLIGLLIIIGIQFWPVERRNPPVSSDIQAPPEVKDALRAACYDCHSNETKWPWYGYIAPASWLLAHDVSEAREKLNFSEWESIPRGDRPAGARQVWREVENGEMPLLMYRIIHSSARLSETQRNILRDWALSHPQ